MSAVVVVAAGRGLSKQKGALASSWPVPHVATAGPVLQVHAFPKAAEAAGSSAPRPTNSALQAGAAAPGGQQGRAGTASSGRCSLYPDLPSHVPPL